MISNIVRKSGSLGTRFPPLYVGQIQKNTGETDAVAAVATDANAIADAVAFDVAADANSDAYTDADIDADSDAAAA